MRSFGLDRLGLNEGAPLPVHVMLPALGQAAIGIECRAADQDIVQALGAASDRDSFDCVMAERAFTRALGGTCHSPVAALAEAKGSEILLRAQLYNEDGSDCIADEAHGRRGDLHAFEALARSMLDRAGPGIRRLFEES